MAMLTDILILLCVCEFQTVLYTEPFQNVGIRTWCQWVPGMEAIV